ncbi:hypothetical protein AB0G04_08405 [Actinoplanes sp. NPDC023801]|uniref:hypothetical protein n=1 Tax=Actinoplanes sp. NPDC023801 TaxID=3154595 RepID=UPI0033CA161D
MTVTLLDLRDPAARPPARPDGRIVVLDTAAALPRHVRDYQDLIGRPTVTGLICVAFGDAGPDEQASGVVLTVPAPLRPDGEQRSAVVWIGDPCGLDWAPHTTPSFAEPDAAALDDLIAGLRIDEVFDAVLTTVAGMPGAVASPAARLAFGPALTASIGEAAAAAARSLAEPGDRASRSLADAVRDLDAEHDPGTAVLAPPIAARARDAERRSATAAGKVRDVAKGWMLFTPDRPTATVGVAMQALARSVRSYRADAARLLDDMDCHLEEQRPPMRDVVALGVAEPLPARGTRIVTGLRELVGERLTDGVSLPDLVHELRTASAFSAPQGVGALHERVRRLTVPDGDLPPFPRRPLSLWTLPLIVLSCLGCVLTAPGTDGPVMGGLLALTWFAVGWLLLARRPGPDGELGFGRSVPVALATYGAAGGLGVAGGLVLGQLLTTVPLVPYPMVLFVVLELLAVAVGLRAWQAAASGWGRKLPLGTLSGAVTTIDHAVDRACTAEWQPMHRRRAVAAVADAAAAGAEVIRQILDETGDKLLPAVEGPDRPETALPELFQVIRGDLTRLCRTALEPVWSAAGMPHGSADAEVAREFRGQLDRYRAHVAGNGLLSPIDPDADQTSREALMTRAWTGSPDARAALCARPGDRMTQLCATGHLGFLSSTAEPALIRFAPRQLAVLLRRDPGDQRISDDPSILWTRGSEFVGTLRLLPLRPESIRYEWGGDAT